MCELRIACADRLGQFSKRQSLLVRILAANLRKQLSGQSSPLFWRYETNLKNSLNNWARLNLDRKFLRNRDWIVWIYRRCTTEGIGKNAIRLRNCRVRRDGQGQQSITVPFARRRRQCLMVPEKVIRPREQIEQEDEGVGLLSDSLANRSAHAVAGDGSVTQGDEPVGTGSRHGDARPQNLTVFGRQTRPVPSGDR